MMKSFICVLSHLGQFLVADVTIDSEYNLMRLGNHEPISVYKAPAWPFLGVKELCYYGQDNDQQANGIIEGVYTDYIVDDLL